MYERKGSDGKGRDFGLPVSQNASLLGPNRILLLGRRRKIETIVRG